MRKTTKIICGIVAAAMMLTACGGSTAESGSSAAETVQSEQAVEPEITEAPTPEPTEEPTSESMEESALDDWEATTFKIADLSAMIGKTADEIEAAYPDSTFISDDSDQFPCIAAAGQIVDTECGVIVQFMDGKAAAAIAYFDLNDATSSYVGEKYMKIRNTLCQSMGNPVIAYDPEYAEVSASQISMAFEDGKEINEKWFGNTYSAEIYAANAEDSAMTLAFYTQEYADALG